MTADNIAEQTREKYYEEIFNYLVTGGKDIDHKKSVSLKPNDEGECANAVSIERSFKVKCVTQDGDTFFLEGDIDLSMDEMYDILKQLENQ